MSLSILKAEVEPEKGHVCSGRFDVFWNEEEEKDDDHYHNHDHNHDHDHSQAGRATKGSAVKVARYQDKKKGDKVTKKQAAVKRRQALDHGEQKLTVGKGME